MKIHAKTRKNFTRFLSLPFSVLSTLPTTTVQRTNTENYKQIVPEKNFAAPVPISTFMCLWAIYIFPRSTCLFCCRKYVDRSWDYINRSQTHECGNWEIEAAQFPEKEFINGVFVAVHLMFTSSGMTWEPRPGSGTVTPTPHSSKRSTWKMPG